MPRAALLINLITVVTEKERSHLPDPFSLTILSDLEARRGTWSSSDLPSSQQFTETWDFTLEEGRGQ